MLWFWNFVTFSFYLLASCLQISMVRDAINSKLFFAHFFRGYLIKFCYFSVVSILCKITLYLLEIVVHPRCYLPNFRSSHRMYSLKKGILRIFAKYTGKRVCQSLFFFPIFPFDPPENIRKPNISYPLIRTRPWTYQGVRNVRLSDVFMGSKRNTGKKR